MVLSVSNCRMILIRPAPSAERTANSCARAFERASSRLATFTHAISNTKPTAPSNTISSGCTRPSSDSRSGISLARIP